jgi:hypothetical protein
MGRKWTDSTVATGTSVAAGDLILTVSDPSGTPVSKKITVQNLMDSDSVREAIRDHLGDAVISGGANVTVTHDDPSDTITVAVTSLDGAVIGSATAAAATFTDLTFTGTLTGDVAASNVTSGTFADARIAESNVTQHQGALSITESQISDLGTYANAVHTHAASDITSGTLADARVAQSNVTQHESALSITESQISDFGTYATAAALTTHTGDTTNPHSVTATQVGLGNVENTALSTWAGSTNLTTLGTITTGTWNGDTIASAYIGSHTHAASDVTSGTFADARIAQSNVTQHQAALSITESQISDFGSYQPLDSGLTSISGLVTSADKMLYTTASDAYALTSLTSFARSILDDADASAVRTTIGVDAAGTDNSTDVTLTAVSGNYLSISGQEITAGNVPISLGGTGATTAAGARTSLGVDPAGTDNSTDVTLAGTYDYLTLSGQQITLGQIDLSTDVTGTLPSGNIGSHTHVSSDITDFQEAVEDDVANLLTAGSGISLSYNDVSGVLTITNTGAAINSLDDINDVTITSATTGDLLRWSGSAWVNYADSNYAAASHTHAASDVTSGTFADARIAQSNVTQHQAALSIASSQISDKASANGVASLDGSGKVPSSQLPAIALSEVFVVSSQSAQLALTAQEGDVVVRTDESKSYIHNGGTAGTMADYTELQTPADAVTSVNGYTGTVSLTTSDVSEGTNLYYTSGRFDTAFAAKDTDDLSEGATNQYFTNARARSAISLTTTNSSELSYDSGTGVFSYVSPTTVADANSVTLEVRNTTGSTIAKGAAVYISGHNGNKILIDLADSDASGKYPAIGLAAGAIANNSDGEVTVYGELAGVDTSSYSVGDVLYLSSTAGALTNTRPTSNADAVQNIGKVARSDSNGIIIVSGSGRANDIPNLANTHVFIGGSSGNEQRALAAGDILSGTFADARISQSSVTQHESALSITESQISDLGTYQTQDAGLTSIAGLTTAADKMLYTTASDTYAVTDLTSFARSILDDTSASAVRTTIGVDVAGTDNSTDVTLAGAYDYLTLSGQQITLGQVDLTTDVTGTLPIGNGGTGATTAAAARTALDVDQAGTDNSTDVTLATVAGNYLSITGQEITAGTVPISLGGTGATTAAGARTALDVDQAGTDNSTDVTIAAGLDYITISGQQLTLGSVDLTTDVTGSLPIANGGTGSTTAADARTALGVDPAGTDNSTDVTLATVSGNYLSITGQEITAGTVPISLGGTGATTASAARTALGVDAAGTDNSTDVTLAGAYDYLTLSGQQITLGQIDLTTDVAGSLPVASGGTGSATAADARTALGVDAAGTDNSTDVTLAGSYDYLTLSGQQVTLGQIDLTTDVTGNLPYANAAFADQDLLTTSSPTFVAVNATIDGGSY